MELAGPECSGRTSLALSFLAGLTRMGQVCAWVDVSDTLHPESAAAAGVELPRLLWIRCGPAPEQLALPRLDGLSSRAQRRGVMEPSFSNLSSALCTLRSPLQAETSNLSSVRCAESQPTIRKKSREVAPAALSSALCALRSDLHPAPCTLHPAPRTLHPRKKPWSTLDQALRATDLLLNAGGFAAIVLDMGSVAPEYALRVPLATWFRYRAAAERTQACVLLLTQQACTKSSAGLVLHCSPGPVSPDSTTVFTGAEYHVEISRKRFACSPQITECPRKPPQSDWSVLRPLRESSLRWQTQTPWSVPTEPAKAGRP